MKQMLRLNVVVPLVLAGFLIATLSFLYFPFFAILSFAFKVFVLVCVIDLIFKTNLRKPLGLVLIMMFIVAITGLLAIALLHYLGFY